MLKVILLAFALVVSGLLFPVTCLGSDLEMTQELSLNTLLTHFFVWSYKIATLVLGYLFARLGYHLLLKGITGEFKFHIEMKGIKADIASALPGLFFILMAAIIIGIGLYKGIELKYEAAPTGTVVSEKPTQTTPEIPPLRPNIFKEDKP